MLVSDSRISGWGSNQETLWVQVSSRTLMGPCISGTRDGKGWSYAGTIWERYVRSQWMVDALSYLKQPGHLRISESFLSHGSHLQVSCAPFSECEAYVFFLSQVHLVVNIFQTLMFVNAYNWFVLSFFCIVSKPTTCLFTRAHNYSNACGIQCDSHPCTTVIQASSEYLSIVLNRQA